MTELLEMARVRELLGMEGRETRLVVRRLRAIVEERGGDFPLWRLAGRWTTTRAAMVALLPELLGAGETKALVEQLAHQAEELAALRRRIDHLERHSPQPRRNAA